MPAATPRETRLRAATARLREFRAQRACANERILATAPLETKRFFALDGAVYRDGALPARSKELLGLVASLVLRCDDCVTYHLIQCRDAGVTRAETVEAMEIGLVVGGSIVIPHLRRATEMLDALETEAPKAATPRRKTAKRRPQRRSQ